MTQQEMQKKFIKRGYLMQSKWLSDAGPSIGITAIDDQETAQWALLPINPKSHERFVDFLISEYEKAIKQISTS
jgi:hypothetical protein